MKKRRKKHPFFRAAPEPLIEGLEEAEGLLSEGRWGEAREVLEGLDERYPNRMEVLGGLLNVYAEVKDMARHQRTVERLVALSPPDPELTQVLASSYLLNFRPALALKTMREFVERWPEHEDAARVRNEIVSLSARMDEMLGQIGEKGEEGLEIAARHERVQSLLDQGRYAQGRRAAEELLKLRPNFVPVLNNLSLILFIEGQTEKAVAAAERVLEINPENFHALANLTRYLYLSGREEEAAERARRLKALKVESEDAWIKKAEALSCLGDDQGVEDVYREAARAGAIESPFLHHLAAVAAMRLGREREARRRWREALKIAPGFDLAEENLEDLALPAAERHAPWPFSMANWVPRKIIDGLIAGAPRGRRASEKAYKRATQTYVEKHPELLTVIRALLDRGDPEGREFALRLALMAETPETLAALRDFALGRRGPDALRMEAANAASEAGFLPAGSVRFWAQGEWREVQLMNFEIHDEAERRHAPAVERLCEEAAEALRDGDPGRAEAKLKRALELEPGAPDAMNNLALAYQMQGRAEESRALAREVHRLHPDYLFGVVAMARLHVQEGRLDEAEELLKPLLARRRMHVSELGALCGAQIELSVAQGREEAARSWLEMWKGADPDHPEVARWSLRLGKNLREKIAGLGALLTGGKPRPE
jgi:tetratricopeptide (TPR) repeat protein